MRADQLYVVTAISNPMLWKSRIALYQAFEQHMLASGVKLTTVECTYGDMDPEISINPQVNHVRVRASGLHKAWIKECLLNKGVQANPDAKYFAFLDADITFRSPHWPQDTLHALQHFPVIQPWTTAYDLGPNGEHVKTETSFASVVYHKGPGAIRQGPGAPKLTYDDIRYKHTGYAWAFTRQALEYCGGLYEHAVLGSADHHMALAMIGHVEWSIPNWLQGAYRAELLQWQTLMFPHVRSRLGALPGTIEHAWHGDKKNRKYVDRWQILQRNNFDPSTDLKKNTWGVIELAGNKPQLAHDIDAYFRAREEDSNTMSA